MNQKVFIIDDEPSICVSLQLALKHLYQVRTFSSSLPAMAAMEKEGADLVLLDLRLGEENGLDLLRRIKQISPHTQVIMMTAYGSIDSSVNAMKNGAYTYLTKPINLEELKVTLAQAGYVRKLNEQVHYMTDELESRRRFDDMVGESPAMQRVYMLIDRVKDIDANVLITGERGTGKSLAAHAIHRSGRRRAQRFVTVNCAAVPENLLELELFGYKKGILSGTAQDKDGKLKLADGGTLFLSEIGEMPWELQGKLLRVIESREVTPIGGSTPQPVDVRIIASSHQDIPAMIAAGQFREELLYRLRSMEIPMPPLRERREDIPALCTYLLGKFSRELNKRLTAIDPAAMETLCALPYPGNVRQLANILEYAAILSTDGVLHPGDLPEELSPKAETSAPEDPVDRFLSANSMRDIELRAIQATLRRFDDKRSPTAASLGISKRGLLNKLKEYDLIEKES